VIDTSTRRRFTFTTKDSDAARGLTDPVTHPANGTWSEVREIWSVVPVVPQSVVVSFSDAVPRSGAMHFRTDCLPNLSQLERR